MKVRRTFVQPVGEVFTAYCPHTGIVYECSDAIKLLQLIAEKLSEGAEWRIVKAAFDHKGHVVMTDTQAERWRQNLPDPVAH